MPVILQNYLSAAQLIDHLEQHFSLKIRQASNLDLNVYAVETEDKAEGPYVARVFPQRNAFDILSRLAALLTYLQQQGFPAERCANIGPVSQLDGQEGCIFVTNFAQGTHPERGKVTFYRMGKLLGQIHTIPIPEGTLAGGAWHHLVLAGGVQEECTVVSRMLDEFEQYGTIDDKDKPQISRLREEVRRVHDAGIQNLPTALVHPDMVPVNIIAAPVSGKRDAWTVVDWVGAGVGPRVLSLGFILSTAVMRGKIEAADAVMKGYHSTEARLKPTELDERLPIAIYERSLVIQCWEVAVGRAKAADVVKVLEEMFEMAEKVARRVREAVGALSRSDDILAK